MNAHGFSRCSIVSTAATTSAFAFGDRPHWRRVEIDLPELRAVGEPRRNAPRRGRSSCRSGGPAAARVPRCRIRRRRAARPTTPRAASARVDHPVDRVVTRSEALRARASSVSASDNADTLTRQLRRATCGQRIGEPSQLGRRIGECRARAGAAAASVARNPRSTVKRVERRGERVRNRRAGRAGRRTRRRSRSRRRRVTPRPASRRRALRRRRCRTAPAPTLAWQCTSAAREQAPDVVPFAEPPHAVVDAETTGGRDERAGVRRFLRPLRAADDPPHPVRRWPRASRPERVDHHRVAFPRFHPADLDDDGRVLRRVELAAHARRARPPDSTLRRRVDRIASTRPPARSS